MSKIQNKTSKALAQAVHDLTKSNLQEQRVVLFKGKQQKANNAVAKKTKMDNNPIKLTSAPATFGFRYKNSIPQFKRSRNSVIITHKEYVGDLTSSSTANAFTCQKYTLNPGNATLFAWLSNEARGFTEYKFHNLSFHIDSQVSSATNGMSAIAISPDIQDPVPASKSILLQFENASRANAWEHYSASVPKDILSRLPRYLVSTVTSGEDDSTRAMGGMYLGSAGMPASTDYGELYASYCVEFSSPTESVGSGVNVSNATPSTDNPFGPNPTTNSTAYTGNIRVTGYNPNYIERGDYIKIEGRGSFLCTFIGAGTVVTLNNIPGFYDSYGVGLNSSTRTPTQSNIVNGAATAGTFVVAAFNMPSPWFIQWSGLVATTVTAVNVIITPYVDTSRLNAVLIRQPLINSRCPPPSPDHTISKSESSTPKDIGEKEYFIIKRAC